MSRSKHAVILFPRYVHQQRIRRIDFDTAADAQLVASVLKDIQGIQYTDVKLQINHKPQQIKMPEELPAWKRWLMDRLFGRFIWP